MPVNHPQQQEPSSQTGTETRVIPQGRDLRLLRGLSMLRVIDREQAALIAGFNSATRVNSRLQKLRSAGLLKRFFFVSALGGKKAVYCLSRKGATLIDVPLNALQRPSDSFLIGDKFVAHQLAINEVYCRGLAGTGANGVGMQNWRNFSKPLSPGTALVPDAYFEIHTGEIVRPMFLEVDRGTEGLPVWSKKIEGYLSFAASGQFTVLFQRPRFGVMAVTLSDRRMQSLRTHVAKFTTKLFYFSTLEKIAASGLWGSIWLRPCNEQSQSLM